MGSTVSAPTARKIKALLKAGPQPKQGVHTGRGTGRYDTHVIITGEEEDGFYPCVPTYYDVQDNVWVEYEEHLAIASNDGELTVDRRYRAICYGEIDGILIFAVDDVEDGGSDDNQGNGEGCGGRLMWLQDIESLTNPTPPAKPKALRLTLVEALGRCECVHVSEGDEFLMIWDADDSAFYGVGSLDTCCGCANVRGEFVSITDPITGQPLKRFKITLAVSEGCTAEAATTAVMFLECGDNGIMYLAGFDEEVCDAAPSDQCSNLYRVKLECVECDLENVGCRECLEKQGPAAWRLTDGTMARKGEGCSCTWTSDCGDSVVTVSAGTIVVAHKGDTYVYDTDDVTPDCNNPPSCFTEHAAEWIDGPSGGGSITITPIFCNEVEPPEPLTCTEGTPDLNIQVTLTGYGTQTGLMPYSDTGYYYGHFVFGQWTGCNGINENYGMGVACQWDGCKWTMVPNGLGAPTGTTVIGSFTYTVHSMRPVYITFAGTLECCILCDSSPGDIVHAPYTGRIYERDEAFPYWCVDGLCSSAIEPGGGDQIDGPFASAEECAIACACQPDGVMPFAPLQQAKPEPTVDPKKLGKDCACAQRRAAFRAQRERKKADEKLCLKP